MRVFENSVLRGNIKFKREEVKRSGENYIMRSLIISISHTEMFGC